MLLEAIPMSLSHFRSYQLSVQFYRKASVLRCPSHLKSQLLRSASSVALNLAEGNGKDSPADQRRFYRIALGSLRESQAVLDLCDRPGSELAALADQLGAHIYRLCCPAPK